MGYSGHNISPSSSDFVPPTYLELEATAAAELPKINLAIVGDTLQHSFTEVQKKDVWKYDSSPPRPSLPPTHNLRVSNPETDSEKSSSWKEQYQNLVKELPSFIQEALEENQKLPHDQQYTSLIALSSALTTLSRALVIVESGAEPLLRESVEERHRQMNEQLPRYTHENYRATAYEVFAQINKQITDLTPNHPSFDHLNYYHSLAQDGLTALKWEERE